MIINSTLSLWDFSCANYTKPEVQSTCLLLQDKHGIDIPLLLFCYWSGLRYGAVSPEYFQPAVSFAHAWSDRSVQPLRHLRRQMKTNYNNDWPVDQSDWEQLREQVKSAELKSEQLLLEGLERLANTGAFTLEAESRTTSEIEADCISNIESCFINTSHTEIRDSLKNIMSGILHEHST